MSSFKPVGPTLGELQAANDARYPACAYDEDGTADAAFERTETNNAGHHRQAHYQRFKPGTGFSEHVHVSHNTHTGEVIVGHEHRAGGVALEHPPKQRHVFSNSKEAAQHLAQHGIKHKFNGGDSAAEYHGEHGIYGGKRAPEDANRTWGPLKSEIVVNLHRQKQQREFEQTKRAAEEAAGRGEPEAVKWLKENSHKNGSEDARRQPSQSRTRGGQVVAEHDDVGDSTPEERFARKAANKKKVGRGPNDPGPETRSILAGEMRHTIGPHRIPSGVGHGVQARKDLREMVKESRKAGHPDFQDPRPRRERSHNFS